MLQIEKEAEKPVYNLTLECIESYAELWLTLALKMQPTEHYTVK